MLGCAAGKCVWTFAGCGTCRHLGALGGHAEAAFALHMVGTGCEIGGIVIIFGMHTLGTLKGKIFLQIAAGRDSACGYGVSAADGSAFSSSGSLGHDGGDATGQCDRQA